MRKNFIFLNKGFICENCGHAVLPAPATCRNHCTKCLASKHVDLKIPGDRASDCQSIMPATTVEGVDPDKLDLIHSCLKCGKTIRNKIASDDNKEAIWKIFNN